MIRVAQVMGYMGGGGVEQVVMNYYRHIDRSCVQFDFLVCEGSGIVPRAEIEGLGGRVFMVPGYKCLMRYMTELERLFCEERWLIVHSHVNALSVFPLRAAKRAGVPVRIAHSHSTAGKGETAKNAVKSVLKRFSNVYPTHRMACSRYAGEWLFGKGADFEVVYNAIDLSRFLFDAEARAQARADLGLVGVEAQAAGLPCFLSDRITREVDVTGTVRFLPIDDPSMWAGALAEVEPGSRIDARREDFEDYDIDRAAERLAARYLELSRRAVEAR